MTIFIWWHLTNVNDCVLTWPTLKETPDMLNMTTSELTRLVTNTYWLHLERILELQVGNGIVLVCCIRAYIVIALPELENVISLTAKGWCKTGLLCMGQIIRSHLSSLCVCVCVCLSALSRSLNRFWWNLAQTSGTWFERTLSLGVNIQYGYRLFFTHFFLNWHLHNAFSTGVWNTSLALSLNRL